MGINNSHPKTKVTTSKAQTNSLIQKFYIWVMSPGRSVYSIGIHVIDMINIEETYVHSYCFLCNEIIIRRNSDLNSTVFTVSLWLVGCPVFPFLWLDRRSRLVTK